MMNRRTHTPLLLLAACLVLLAQACSRQADGGALPSGGQAAYYWRTDLHLDSTERAFISRHHISRLYCRFFDVVSDSDDGSNPHPNATITFSDTLPKGLELVPTVYITENCMHQRHDSLAARVVQRVVQMCRTNGISGVSELQLDCDYTARSLQVYYDFLSEARRQAAQQGLALSVTIRLHQLQMKAPPADYGVLMLYNTGDPRRFRERNPVLDERDVQPYVRHLGSYPLPLSAAYPVYRWVRQVEGVRVEHTVSADVILRVKQMVEQQRPELSRHIIIYHIDEENINRYTPETYEAIFHH